MKLYKKEGKIFAYKHKIAGSNSNYDTETLINPDSLVTASTPNGWVVYDKSANASEVYLMLSGALTDEWPRWQINYNTYDEDNRICYFKTPEKGIITKVETMYWWDGTYYKRGCCYFDIYGFETEADLLTFKNGTKIIHHEGSSNSNLKGKVYSYDSLTDKPFQYFAIKMDVRNASDGYKSIGATKFYMKVSESADSIKCYGWGEAGSGNFPNIPNQPNLPSQPEPNYGVTLVGNTKIENDILSGFDENSYAILNYTLPNNLMGREFEIYLDFTIGDDATTVESVFDTNRDGIDSGWWIATKNELLVGGSGNGIESASNTYNSYWNIARHNYVKLKITNKDSSEAAVYVTQEGYPERYYGIIPNITPAHGVIVLGKAGADISAGQSSTTGYFTGTFNLANCYIEIDGVKVWEGVKHQST